MKNIVIIVAGGQGKRMGGPKQFLKINGRPMLGWTLDVFHKSRLIDGIIIVTTKEQLPQAIKLKSQKIIAIVEGGRERDDSVRKGLAVLPKTAQFVLIHDGARPAVTPALISRSLAAAKECGAAVVGIPLKDTIKRVENPKSTEKQMIQETVDRHNLWAAQTPQTFRAPLIVKAYEQFNGTVTDDAMVVEKMGIPVKIVLGDYNNIKVTTPEDLVTIGAILKMNRRKLA